MIRVLAWLWHRSRGNHWMRLSEGKARAAREAFVASRLGADRARAHFARADDLFPPPPRGPPDLPDTAESDRAPPNT